jgi:hypothetical protein
MGAQGPQSQLVIRMPQGTRWPLYWARAVPVRSRQSALARRRRRAVLADFIARDLPEETGSAGRIGQ